MTVINCAGRWHYTAFNLYKILIWILHYYERKVFLGHQICLNVRLLKASNTNLKRNAPVISSSLSAKVLLPWSMCAMMQKFRILSTWNLERSMDSLFFFLKKERMAATYKFAMIITYYSGLRLQWLCYLIGLCADHLVAASKQGQPFPPATSDQCADPTTTHFSSVHFELENTLYMRFTQMFY